MMLGGTDFLRLVAETRHLELEVGVFQRLSDDDGEFVEVERFADVVVGPQPHGVDGRFEAAVGGHHDDHDLLIVFLDLFQDLNAVDARHLDIEQHQIGLFLPNQAQRLFAVTGGNDLVALLLQILLQRPADQVFVVDDQ